jgi:hypothetical protein
LGNEGHLTGRLASRKGAPHVNFRNQSGIYILQEGFRPVYIGQAGRSDQRLFTRLKAHTQNHLAERWDRFSWFGIYPIKKGELDASASVVRIQTNIDSVLNHIEGVLISVTEPPLNRQGARFGKAEQYRQVDLRAAEEDEGDE